MAINSEILASDRPDPQLEVRIEELARKSTEGELTDDERAEYAAYVHANKIAAILKRQAQHLTSSRDDQHTS